MRVVETLCGTLALFPCVLLAQGSVVIGQVRVQDGGQPLGYSAVSVLAPSSTLLTGESGKFMLLALPAGQVTIRVKHIGYAPKDTVVTLAGNDTVRLDVSLPRLVIQLPAMIVSGKCTNTSPTEPLPAVLAELFDQVNQNAERYKLLAKANPFVMQVYRVRGVRNPGGGVVPTRIDTVVRRPLPPAPYAPKRVVQRGEGNDADGWVLALPELPDFADTAFTNNHCFRYAGQTRYEGDSVIAVEFEPVPWLNKETDIEGTMFLRADGYQLVATVSKLNRIPSHLRNSGLQEVTVRARFSEIVSGVAVLDEWDLTTRYRRPQPPRTEIGQVFGIKWTDTTAAKVDTVAGRDARRHR
jgi:hypothetical protein